MKLLESIVQDVIQKKKLKDREKDCDYVKSVSYKNKKVLNFKIRNSLLRYPSNANRKFEKDKTMNKIIEIRKELLNMTKSDFEALTGEKPVN